MLPILIMQAGNPPAAVRRDHGSFGEMVRTAGAIRPASARIVRVYAGERPEAPRHYSGAIITGSPANVTDPDTWIAQAAGWVRDAMDAGLPLFGICFGHQLLAQAMGGRVDFHPDGQETGTHMIEQTAAGLGDSLLLGVPARFAAQCIHAQSVFEAPPGATVLAGNAHDAHQALRLSDTAVSVQFHPEFTAPAMRAYCEVLQRTPQAATTDFAALGRAVTDTPEAAGILARYVARHMPQGCR